MTKTTSVVRLEAIENRILLIRGQKVMLDRDLAALYGVPTKALNQAVTRNAKRFPSDFMFRLSRNEMQELVTDCDRFESLKHSSAAPRPFTEQGVAMLSSVLNSDGAVQVNIAIMRTFIRLRRVLADHVELARRLDALEKKHDAQFKVVFDAIRALMTKPEPKQKRVGDPAYSSLSSAALRENLRGGSRSAARERSPLHFLCAFASLRLCVESRPCLSVPCLHRAERSEGSGAWVFRGSTGERAVCIRVDSRQFAGTPPLRELCVLCG